MIWYDVVTKDPVAPGACEDSGLPSIPHYMCATCRVKRELRFDTYRSGQLVVSIGRCTVCYRVLLTSA